MVRVGEHPRRYRFRSLGPKSEHQKRNQCEIVLRVTPKSNMHRLKVDPDDVQGKNILEQIFIPSVSFLQSCEDEYWVQKLMRFMSVMRIMSFKRHFCYVTYLLLVPVYVFPN